MLLQQYSQRWRRLYLKELGFASEVIVRNDNRLMLEMICKYFYVFFILNIVQVCFFF